MPLLHSFLVYRAGTMSVKVSWAEPNWSVLMKNEHADKDEAETWDIRVELVRYRKVDFHHDGRIALPDAVVNFVFSTSARVCRQTSHRRGADLSWVTHKWLQDPFLE